MIEAVDLTKRFGTRVALDRVSLAVARGEVVGLLGPNGAGKTTTLRILASYLPASSGRALIAGRDVAQEPLAARRALGYLPEGAPHYVELRVEEYLRFRARLRGLRRGRCRAAVDGAVERCGLGEARRRVIGALSKGYRQRVGLADALLGEPGALILDEPTVGLDPAQSQEIRELIRGLGRERAVLLSTHLLGEVEAICDRVVILARGVVAESGTTASLTGEASVVVAARGDAATVETALAAVPGAREVKRLPDEEVTFRVTPAEPGADLREAVGRAVIGCGASLVELRRERRTLEQAFLAAIRASERAAG